jgi:hypothetical protein
MKPTITGSPVHQVSFTAALMIHNSGRGIARDVYLNYHTLSARCSHEDLCKTGGERLDGTDGRGDGGDAYVARRI